ncbi:MAG: ChuX/HutX family heme-like substrate-binding protein [Bacteroidota bacterium]
MNTLELKTAWQQFKEENPRVRIRDAAKQLGVSEAQLLATDIGEGVTRLKSEWYDMLLDKESLGEVMALTRNEVFVHEKVGNYSNASVMPDHKMGQTLDKNIDLRIFFRNWHFAFAVHKEDQQGEIKRSLQYFDAFGNAVHKTHLRPESNVAAYNQFVKKYQAEDQSQNLVALKQKAHAEQLPDECIDKKALQDAWNALRDTHDFIFMLRKFSVTRLQAFRIAGPEFARQVDTSSFTKLLEQAAENGLSMMIFVNNPGCTQIHSGPIHKLKLIRDWYNILDPGFNLHVKHKEINSTWIVRKPVETGEVHSLEVFDDAGQVLCYLFSKRKEGQHEVQVWRDMLAQQS